jgi:hypothetical protein
LGSISKEVIEMNDKISGAPLALDEIEQQDIVWAVSPRHPDSGEWRLVLHKECSPDGKTELINSSGARIYAASLLRGGWKFYRHQTTAVIDTTLGQLVVELSSDPDYPGVYVDLHRDGCECDATLALVECPTTDWDSDKPEIITRIWDNVVQEDFQTKVAHTGIEEYFEGGDNSGQ